MELVAFFVWPAVALAVVGWIGFSSLPKKDAVLEERQSEASTREELHLLQERIEQLERAQKRRSVFKSRMAEGGRLVILKETRAARPETRAALSRVIPAE